MNSDSNVYLACPQTESDWDQYYQLRWELLRKGWQQPVGSERDEHEVNAFHITAKTKDNFLVGVGRIHLINRSCAQIRYMAVKKEHQRQGIGKKLLITLETQACDWKVSSIILNARDSHIGFYLSHQYECVEPADTLYGLIKHTKMRKNIITAI